MNQRELQASPFPHGCVRIPTRACSAIRPRRHPSSDSPSGAHPDRDGGVQAHTRTFQHVTWALPLTFKGTHMSRFVPRSSRAHSARSPRHLSPAPCLRRRMVKTLEVESGPTSENDLFPVTSSPRRRRSRAVATPSWTYEVTFPRRHRRLAKSAFTLEGRPVR